MSADLHTLIREAGDEAASAHSPAPVDTAELWKRGRRQRTVRRTAPVLAVLAVVGMGTAAVATAYGSDVLQPLMSEDSAPLPEGSGWADVNVVKGLDAAELPVTALDDESAPVVASIQTGFWAPTAPFDVDTDGTLVWVDPDDGILVKPAGADSAEIVGMPAEFLKNDGMWVVFTVQWGPDGRIYVTGQDPEAAGPREGLTQIAVVERDGTLVGVRENDALQDSPLVFADGFAWQEQRSQVMLEDGTSQRTVPDGQQRWQALAEIGGKVLQMPDQRASEVIGAVAPDGMHAESSVADDGNQSPRMVLDVQVGDRLHTREVRSVGWGSFSPPRNSQYRVWSGHAETTGFLGQLTGARQSLGGLLVVTDREGRTVALRDEGILADLGQSHAFVGPDGHLYLGEITGDDQLDIRRYVHPLPGHDAS